MAMPSDVYETLTISNGSWTSNIFTAGVSGFVFVILSSSTSSGSLGVYTSSFGFYDSHHSERISVLLSVSEGQQYDIKYSGGTAIQAKFIYSVGSAKKLRLI